MNKLGKGPNLTWIFIGIAFAIVSITLSMTSYEQFLSDNGVSVSDGFSDIYRNISSEQDSLDIISDEATANTNIFGVVGDIAGGTSNVFITGLSSIRAFFDMNALASSIFSTSMTAIPGLDALFGLLVLISGLYIIMALIKARRGVGDVA